MNVIPNFRQSGMALNSIQQAAVIVMFESASNSLILTKRSDKLRDHPGEICFPGGLQEAGDRDLYATAARELEEELGIGASRLHLIQKLNPEITSFGVHIQPWLVSIDSIIPHTINTEEVAQIIFVPMSSVENLENYKDLSISRSGHRIQTCQFTGSKELIWGATARIMKQLSLLNNP